MNHAGRLLKYLFLLITTNAAYGTSSAPLCGGRRAHKEFFRRRRAMPRLAARAPPENPKTGGRTGRKTFDRLKREDKLTPHGDAFRLLNDQAHFPDYTRCASEPHGSAFALQNGWGYQTS